MVQKQPIELGAVQQTLLIPLYGRAVETAKPRALLRDHKAVELVKSIDYDFAKFGGGPSMVGCVLRTEVFDSWVRAFLDEHPQGTVVEIGAGLNTRFERLDNGTSHWVEFDLPDVVALRRRLFAEHERRVMLDCSVLDEGWLPSVAALPGPYFFVAEAVLFYLPVADVHTALGLITGGFAGARLAFDTGGAMMMRNQDRHDAMRHMSGRMQWECGDPREVERWGYGLRLVESCGLGDVRPGFLRQVPLRQRVMPAISARLSRLGKYRMNLFHVSS